MFHGGENPEGRLSTLQESQATGYPNDLPIRSYDFQAPIGAYGQERASLGKMKIYQYFLNAFGSDLAPMEERAPEVQPHDPADFSVPRAALRSRGDSGFLFLNNYVRNYTMPARPAAQFEVKLPGGVLRIPARPVEIPSGAYFIWPIHLNLGGIDLVYSTAQPFTRVAVDGAQIIYFAAVRGIAPEFAFTARDLAGIQSSSGSLRTEGGISYLSGIAPGANSWIDLTAKSGNRIRLKVLSSDEAEHAWKVRLNGGEHLLICEADVIAAEDGRVRLHARGETHFSFTLTPPPAVLPKSSLALTRISATAQSAAFTADAPEHRLEVEFQQTHLAGIAPPVKLPPPPSWRANGVAQAPDEGELPGAAQWSLRIPGSALDGLSDVFLQFRYQGDVARLYAGSRLLTDDFFNGLDWPVGLKRFLNGSGAQELRLSILPLRKDAPVYFELPRAVDFDKAAQAARLENVRLIPEYELVLGASEE
jgi:hypothetical protein